MLKISNILNQAQLLMISFGCHMVMNEQKKLIKLWLSIILLYSFTRISENSNVFVQLFSGVIARMKPGEDGKVFIANEAGENVERSDW